MDEILKKFNLKYEDLTTGERETLHGWMSALQRNELTVSSVRDYIESMRDAVEMEISKNDHNSIADILLKARLRNYLLLLSFLISPEKAKQAMERAIAGINATKR